MHIKKKSMCTLVVGFHVLNLLNLFPDTEIKSPVDGEHISPFINGETRIIYLSPKLYQLLPI